MRWRLSLAGAAIALSFGCSKSEEDPQGEPSAEQVGAAQQASTAATTVTQSLTATSVLFESSNTPDGAPLGMDMGGLQRDRTEQENLQSMQMQASTELGGCGTVTIAPPGLVIDYGPPPGCTLMNGHTVSGAITLALSVTLQSMSMGLTFDQLVVDTTDLDGTLSFDAAEGSVGFDMLLTSGTTTTDVTLTLSAATPTVLQIDGTGSVTEGSSTTALAFDQVQWAQGACYPQNGTLVVTAPPAAAGSIAFDSSTPTTGKATLTFQTQLGPVSVPFDLPPYGSCPPA